MTASVCCAASLMTNTCEPALPQTFDLHCLQLCFLLCWSAAHQQVLNVIFQHNDDEQPPKHHSLGYDVSVCHMGQVHAYEDIGNCQGQCGPA